MPITFSEMIEQFVADGNAGAIPNPSRSGYLCKPSDFLFYLIRFLSMMQVLKVGVGNEIASLKKSLNEANRFFKKIHPKDKVYRTMVDAVNCIDKICQLEGEKAYATGEVKLAETYAWSIAGCRLFLGYIESVEER